MDWGGHDPATPVAEMHPGPKGFGLGLFDTDSVRFLSEMFLLQCYHCFPLLRYLFGASLSIP